MTTPLRQAYLAAAATVPGLLRHPAVAAKWDEPSALAEFSVRGLAGHLAAQTFTPPALLSAAADPDRPVRTLLEHYGQVQWVGADVNADINVSIREGGEAQAVSGVDDLASRVDAAIAQVRPLLADAPADRLVSPGWLTWSLPVDDFLVTRMMEIAVHSDDLACSVGIDAPALPDEVLEPVVDLLTRLALRRHGQAAVLRGLSRAERAPATITAF